MPPIGRLLVKAYRPTARQGRLRGFYVLDHGKGMPASLADAKAKGVPVIAYGAFINDVINFIIVAFVVFLLVKMVNQAKDTRTAPALGLRPPK